MADPLSISASVLAVLTAAIQSTKSLYEAVKRFKDRNKTLRRLQDELEDLGKILNSLNEAINADASVMTLLQGPLDRCGRVCREFERSMKKFSGKPNTSFLDWTKMEFMRGDINDFIDTISGYKSTISVGLGTITMHTSKVSHQVLLQYNEIIQDTAYNLELHLRQIDEKMARLTAEDVDTSDVTIDLKDERAVTKQCLRICADARSFIETLTTRESTVLEDTAQNTTDDGQNCFEAQLLTRQALDDNRDKLVAISGRLQRRLETLLLDDSSEKNEERLRLEDDIKISKQCLEVCKVASEVSHQKIYRIGEVVADGDSDQVVVTTLADLFDVKKALSKGNSAQLIGSMNDQTLQQMAKERYNSRFGALPDNSVRSRAGTSSAFETRNSKQTFPPQPRNDGQPTAPEARHNRPSPNEMRKRMADDGRD